ncbi:uncharacterized protein DS421_18g615850 [Arachis hypogaea]|nr:uncharacterized protein DS421_18g615850 [Arachis hypogaea]
MTVVTIVCFNIVEFHHVDQVKRQFGSKQPVPVNSVNVDRFLTTTRRGEDMWWPTHHQLWERRHDLYSSIHKLLTYVEVLGLVPACLPCRVRHLFARTCL